MYIYIVGDCITVQSLSFQKTDCISLYLNQTQYIPCIKPFPITRTSSYD